MIAVKREVAARQKDKLRQVFRGANVKLGNWRQVTVRTKRATKKSGVPCEVLTTHTGECTVTACRTEVKSTKRRRLFLWQVK